MIDCEITTTTTTRQPQLANCAQCGRDVKANVQMLRDAPVVCSKCRCCVCRIVLSDAVCRCGVRHGQRSSIKELCERCYGLMETGSFGDLSLGILESAILAGEEALRDQNLLMDDDLNETDEQEADEVDREESLVDQSSFR